MKLQTIQFPYIALALGAVLFLVIAGGSQPQGDAYTLPLLTLLILSEGAFILNLIAVIVGVKHFKQAENKRFYIVTIIVCLVFAVWFLMMGIQLWPDMSLVSTAN